MHSLTLDVATLLASLYITEGSYTSRYTNTCIRYIATDFHVDWYNSVFENQLQSWSTDFAFLPASSLLSESAEASGVILQLTRDIFRAINSDRHEVYFS